MDPTIIVAILVTGQILYQAWMKYRADRATVAVEAKRVTIEGDISLAGIVDGRLRDLLERQDERIAHLETEMADLEHRFNRAVTYMRANGLPWPPEEESFYE